MSAVGRQRGDNGYHRISIDVSPTVFMLLRVLGGVIPAGGTDAAAVQKVVETLVDHAQQGVYRPGSWERGWLQQAFGDAWEQLLEPGDPYRRFADDRSDLQGKRIFQRPRRSSRREG